MRNFKPFLVLLIAINGTFVACKKDAGPSGTSGDAPVLSLSKTKVKIGEPVYATTTGQASGSTVQWSTSSLANGRVWTSGSTDSATYLFTGQGTYEVMATYINGSHIAVDSSRATVIVSDSVFGDTTTMHCNSIVVKDLSPNDQIELSPISFSDTGLVFVAHTQMLYNQSPLLDCAGNIHPSGGTFECDFNSALEYACFGSPTPSPAVGIVSFTSVSNGAYDLLFQLNGVEYKGSFIATDSEVTITWPSKSGVTISPLTIQKQH